MFSSIPKTPLITLLCRMGGAVAFAGIWAGSAAAQTIDFGQRLPNSGYAQPPGLNSFDSSVPLTVQSVGAPADLSSLTPSAGLGQYVVYVNGDSDLLLQQVRRIEPGAFRRTYNNRQVIQVGRFLTQANAQERVTELENRGILSEIVTLNPSASTATGGTPIALGGTTSPSSTITPIPLETTPLPVNTTLEFAAPNTGTVTDFGTETFAPNLSLGQTPAYYVAIPSRPGDLAALTAQLSATGVNPSLIVARASRRGAFVGLGPYSDRLSAEVMVANIKSAGFRNARVYFGY